MTADPHSQADIPPANPPRISDRTALALLGAYLVFRMISQRVGIGMAPRLLDPAPWAIPLLNNDMFLVMTAGTGAEGRPGMLLATAASSVFLSLVAGLILYWAGYRFGPKLAVQAEKSGSMWGQIWNPKQVAKAHNWIERWGVFAVFLGRLVQWFTTPVILVAGSTRMTFRKFIAAYTAGAIAFAGMSLWLGGAAQRRWPGLKDRIADLAPWALRITIILLVLLIVSALLARGQENQEEASDPEPSGSGDA